MRRLSAVIFDLDGLLIDTEQMARRSFEYALTRLGLSVEAEFFLSLIGRTARDSDVLIQARFGESFSLAEYKRHTRAHFERELGETGIPVKHGARDLLDWLREASIPVSLATSSMTDRAYYKLEVAGLAEYFDIVVGGDQVANGKPAPDIVLKAGESMGIGIDRCVVFEDSFNGIRAAHAAGAVPIMVPDLIEPEPAIVELTHEVIGSLAEAPALLESFQRD